MAGVGMIWWLSRRAKRKCKYTSRTLKANKIDSLVKNNADGARRKCPWGAK